jgi:hypothetical protein
MQQIISPVESLQAELKKDRATLEHINADPKAVDRDRVNMERSIAGLELRIALMTGEAHPGVPEFVRQAHGFRWWNGEHEYGIYEVAVEDNTVRRVRIVRMDDLRGYFQVHPQVFWQELESSLGCNLIASVTAQKNTPIHLKDPHAGSSYGWGSDVFSDTGLW